MAKSLISTTISIDTDRSVFHFYSMIGNDKSTIAHHIKGYAGTRFDDDFFGKFKEAVKEFVADNPSESIQKITVVLPDNAVLTDAVRIPTMKGLFQTKKMLDVTLGGLYRNYSELRVSSYVAAQNRQYSTFAISAVQKHIISSIYAACSENKLLVETLTYASCAAVGGATLLNPKLKNGSYLFLDIKDVYSRFVFVANGKPVGYYALPFGLEFLRKPKVVGEDMLFDHSYAELTVLNASERARSKKLTVMSLGEEYTDPAAFASISENELLPAEGDEGATEDDEALEKESADTELAITDAENEEEDDLAVEEESVEEDIVAEEESDEDIEDEDEHTSEVIPALRPQLNQKVFIRKSPRKLPKFMLREIPEDEEGIAYENFRVFVKWALTLIQGNEKLTELGKPEFVCVNLPEDLVSVIDKVNEESEENGITFTCLPVAESDKVVAANLELYGGLFPKQISSAGKF